MINSTCFVKIAMENSDFYAVFGIKLNYKKKNKQKVNGYYSATKSIITTHYRIF